MEMEVSNKKYESIILKVKELRLQIKLLHRLLGEYAQADVEDLYLQLHNEIARGLTYANEVYASEGAVLYTVVGDQGAQKERDKRVKKGEKIKKIEYQLSDEHYLQSINENVGDSLHALKQNKDNPKYAVYRAGKYINRLCASAFHLIQQNGVDSIDAYPLLKEIGDKSVKEKAGDAGRDPKAVQDSPFFSKYTKGDLAVVKSWVMGLGAKATVIYKKSQR